jgi:DNA-binding MarR family transcriptional regulator
MMQILYDAIIDRRTRWDGQVERQTQADPAAVDAALAVGRRVISPGAEAGEPTAAQCRALGLLASRSHWRLADMAGALGVAPSSAGRMCDRLARQGLVHARRASGDRRAVLISVAAAGRKAAEEAELRQRALAAGILARFPASAQRAVAEAFRDFAAAAGEVPAGRRPQSAPAGAPVPRPRPAARPGRPVPRVPAIRAHAQEQHS